MPTSTATVVYQATATRVTKAVLSAAMQAVPIPLDVVAKVLGCLVNSDTPNAGANPVLRTIVFGLVPSVDAVATVTLTESGEIAAVHLSGDGAGYVVPPTVSLPRGPNDNVIQDGQISSRLAVDSVSLGAAGSGYLTAPALTFVGGLPTDGSGVAATGHTTINVGGHVTNVFLDTPGSGYVGVPTAVISGGGGSGATATVVMHATLSLDFPGKGYQVPPVVVITPRFKQLFPDGIADQTKPFIDLMTDAISAAIGSPVIALAPVVA